MNSVNASTDYLSLPTPHWSFPMTHPSFAPTVPILKVAADILAANIIKHLETDLHDAQDNLLTTKFTQAKQANKMRGPDPNYKVGECVKLSTANRRGTYMHGRRKVNFMSPNSYRALIDIS
jgi:hypothetical protein